MFGYCSKIRITVNDRFQKKNVTVRHRGRTMEVDGASRLDYSTIDYRVVQCSTTRQLLDFSTCKALSLVIYLLMTKKGYMSWHSFGTINLFEPTPTHQKMIIDHCTS